MITFKKANVIPTNGDFSVGRYKFAYAKPDQSLYVGSHLITEKGGGVDFFSSDDKISFFDFSKEKIYLKNLTDHSPAKPMENVSLYTNTFYLDSVILIRSKIEGTTEVTEFLLADAITYQPHKILFEIDNLGLLQRFENYLILMNIEQNSLIGYDVDSSSITWKLDEIKEKKLKKIDNLFKIKEKFYAKINKQLIAEIDIITGEVTRTWSNIYFENPEYVLQPGERKTIIPFFTHDCLLRENTRIGSLYDRGYREINLETGEITHDYLLDYFREEQVTPFTNTTVYTHNDLIFFSSQHPNEEENRMEYAFGAFDSHTRQIVARYTFPPGEVGRGIKGPVANDKQVFILDYNNHLHVFDILA